MLLRAADGATAEVLEHGAHVTSWRPAPAGDERLFLSSRSEFRDGVAIRGGIPVIFPQFAAEGPLPRHGFARTMRWTLGAVDQSHGRASARLHLAADRATRDIWPAEFAAELHVDVGGDTLAVALQVHNAGREPFHFTAALHTYLRVHDIGEAALHGLAGTRFRESAVPGVFRVDDEPVLRVHGEMDRVYAGATWPLTLRDGDRALEISATGFPDAVVWNPGATKAAALADMEPGGERRMLCVEPAAVQQPVVLHPGEMWRGDQRLRALPPSPSRDSHG